ncbi:MAG: CRISPR-associated endonuclease Cas1 [Lentisphaeria bacterium]|nr:CRISPR-associated endonuclease Cas1 [Lentisphaeria bacterium]
MQNEYPALENSVSRATCNPDPIPLRMLNEFVYCPRLFYLMHVEGLMEASADVWQGRYSHATRDQVTDRKSRRSNPEPAREVAPNPDGKPANTPNDTDAGELPSTWREATALSLGSETLGLIGKLDTVLLSGQTAVPVEFKKGKAATADQARWCWHGLWKADAIQLGAQALLLQEHDYAVPRVEAYYAASRKLIVEPFDDALANEVRRALKLALQCQKAHQIPPPLEDSPKCLRCSLNEVCLPEESALLAAGHADYLGEPDSEDPPARRIIPPRIDESILVVDAIAATVRKRGKGLSVDVPKAIAARDGSARSTRIDFDAIHEVCLVGAVQVTAQTMIELLSRGIPVSYLTRSGKLLGSALGRLGNNVDLRIRQHRICSDEETRLPAARRMIWAKIRNQRTLLRRNDRDNTNDPAAKHILPEMAFLAAQTENAAGIDVLMGLEGRAARLYFQRFAALVKDRTGGDLRLAGRNRRPPRDPINAMLSFGYAMLAKDFLAITHRVGFDPLVGVLHAAGYGRPALALDLMEEFRPLIVDSTVLRLLAQSQATPADFQERSGGVLMKPAMRRTLIRALEQRKKQLVTHPVFGYRLSYARTMDLQARLLARWFLGEAPEYLPFTTR